MNKKLQFLFVIILLVIISNDRIYSQVPNFRIHPSLNAQIEPAIVKHPVNPLILFASAYTITNSFRSEGVYVSTNGGVNWFGSDTCNTGGSTNNHGGDPGPIIDKDGRFILTHQGNFIVGMFSNNSTDLGNTWTGNYQIASGDQDKGTPGTDDYSSSPYYGRTYLVWTKFLNPFPIVSAYTTNGGTNWSTSSQINTTPAGYISLGGDIKTNVDGAVCVSWAGVITSSPQNEKFCGFARSTDGGVSWVTNENIFEMNGVKTSSLQPWNIRINGFPHIEIDKSGSSRNGWIYIVTGEKNLLPAGTDPDIIFHRSSDNGTTWSNAVRVNQDPLNNGKVQYFPAINVDDDGGINIVYYDNRNISSDSMDVYLSRSTDGGDTWRDYRINEFRFRPKSVTGAVGSGNQGDNIGVVFANNRLMPVWMADNSGIYQIWTARIDLNTIGIKQISQVVPDDFSLGQNYPNPFNPSTNLEFGISEAGFVSLKIYDMLGREKAVLVNGNLNAGTYSFNFDGTALNSGIYFYKIDVKSAEQNFTSVKKMMLVK